MNWTNIIEHFGTESALREATGWSNQRIYNYKKRGRLQTDAQLELEMLTNGALKADLPQYFRKQAA